MRRILVPLIFGLGGCAILISLGLWQLRRLDWKETVLAEITAKLTAAPLTLADIDATPDPDTLRFTPVTVRGRTTGADLLVLTSQAQAGPGYRVISAFDTDDGRKIMVDRGFIADAASTVPRPAVPLALTGNLHWPRESDSFTPPPDFVAGIWFARDTDMMAAKLGTEHLLVVARSVEGDAQGISPLPIDTSGIPNDHLQYAITWFALAVVWLGMTGFLLWRIRRMPH